ncbi:uncharacterized protein LOC112568199 isoform X2 [Pomacea canaliculata]|uniref:uncharacterized protein LOC112568199 isoform X2 n=1 Tax=Pomacea canaliculata TaxID=400727 RepID=UPI000D7366D1|nr:uncharacterized protein LOC112568199 isoform X2 [Pomacea canaliculata]
MEMAYSTNKNHIIICFICAFLIEADCVKGQEYKCEIQIEGRRFTKVKWSIPNEYSYKQRPFTIAYKSPDGKTEDVVVLYYVGHYTCVANPGYTCDKDSNTTFISADITDGVYTLTADGDAGVLCTAAYSQTESLDTSNDIHKENGTGCSNDGSNNRLIGIICAVSGVSIVISLIVAGVICQRYRKIVNSGWKNARIQKDLGDAEQHCLPMPESCVKTIHTFL